MTQAPSPTRRTLVKTAGTAALLGLAGCLGAQPVEQEADNGDDGGHDDESGHDDEGGHDDDGHGHDEAIGDPVEHATVTMTSTDAGEHFEPHIVRVQPGGTVTWELEGGVHTATAYHPDYDRPLRMPEGATPWDSGMLGEAGTTFEHTFETEGVYDYFCAPHEAMGMIGSVVVGEPDAHGQPALEDPQAEFPDTAREKHVSLNERVNEALGHVH